MNAQRFVSYKNIFKKENLGEKSTFMEETNYLHFNVPLGVIVNNTNEFFRKANKKTICFVPYLFRNFLNVFK